MTIQSRMLSLGDWDVHIFEEGRLALDGGSMFGSVPRPVWEKRIQADSHHRIPLSMRLLLLENKTLGHKVLVDTGIGDKYSEAFGQMFKIEHEAEGEKDYLGKSLKRIGYSLNDITHTILTHMHFDHGGGVSCIKDGVLQLTLPKAKHFLQKRNWETAIKPNPRERASYLKENVDPLRDADLELLAGEEEVLPGLRLIPSHGHTDGMQVLRIEGGSQVAYFPSDLSPTQHHIHIPFSMGYDIRAIDIINEKEVLWAKALQEEALIILEHDPDLDFGKLVHDGRKYSLEKVS